MENELQIREIIGSFIHKDAAEINANTMIDRSAVRSSIHVHRMYAALAEAGVIVVNPNGIRTFGDLLAAIGSKADHGPGPAIPETVAVPDTDVLSIGIDIEEIANFAEVLDFREDEFYKQNFSGSEIAWCVLQSHPLESFAGKFAAKEAIIKADNRFKSIPFHAIEVLNDPAGRPRFDGFEVSISHTSQFAVAIAVAVKAWHKENVAIGVASPPSNRLLWMTAIVGALLGALALVLR